MKKRFIASLVALSTAAAVAGGNPVLPSPPPSPPPGINPGAPQQQDPRYFIVPAFTNNAPAAPTNYLPHWTNQPPWSNPPAWNSSDRTNLIISNTPPWKGPWTAATNTPPWRGPWNSSTNRIPVPGTGSGWTSTNAPSPWAGPDRLIPATNPPPWRGPIWLTNTVPPSGS